MTPTSTPAATKQGNGDRQAQLLAGQVRLLYENANLGVAVTVIAASILAQLQWGVVSHRIVAGWWLYMFLVSAARFILARLYWRAGSPNAEVRKWRSLIALGAGLSGAGWGAAGILMYSEAQPANQVFLVFILGGMILGAASTLAARPEAFLSFILPTGLAPAARLILQTDRGHVDMGLLAALFTVATVITTWRIHLTIVSSLNLQFDNADLVGSLKAVTSRTEALNEQLEARVQERTAELQRSSEQLRAEITQREQVEEELLRARKLESLGVLAGGIAHDFNNFLAIVLGNVELAKMRLDPGAPVQSILDDTVSACQRAASLSSQLLTFSKGGAPIRRLVSLAKLVMDAVPLVRAGAHTQIEVRIADDLRCAEVDPAQIGQVIHNVLLNARESMPHGGIIEVRAENAEIQPGAGTVPRVRLSIRDHGLGIPADVLPRIFDPYFSTKPGASGLGLATAYAIVVKHGGEISVKTEPGDGSLFTIDLPASQERPAPEVPAAASLEKGTERILVMDDEEVLLRLVKSVLTNLGYEVETALDGAEAIKLAERARTAGRRFDAALLDLTVVGGMGGTEAAAKLKTLDPSLKLIVSSGYSDAAAMSDLERYGFDDVIPKPWTVAQVSEVFRRVLAGGPQPTPE